MSLPFQEKTDEQLMDLYCKGHAEAFDQLYSRYEKRLYGFLRKKIAHRETCDELMQTIFQKLHASRAKYKTDLPFAAWLFTISRNTIIDHYRKSGRKSESASPSIEGFASDEPSQRKNIGIDLDSLPAKQRTAVELRYEQELPFEEIAERLKTNEPYARQLVSRGIRKLRLLYKS